MSDGPQLRERVRGNDPSVQDFELAARNRLDDAMRLLLGGRWLGAVYLLGYVAEIFLKTAVYRRLGARPNDQAGVFFWQAQKRAEEFGLWRREEWEGGHGLTFWAHLAWSLPNKQGKLLRSAQRNSLREHVHRIESRWVVEMRYSTDPASRQEAEAVVASVEWIMRNRLALWR